MALFNGTENFVPAFEGQKTALQAGSQLQHGLAQGMAFGLRKREMDAEERQRMEQISALGKMTGFVKEGAPIPSKDTNFNVSAATHLINKFVEDPSWLVNPYTSKVATAMAGTAAEVVKLHLDGMRIKAASEAETGGTLTANRVGSSLLKLAEGGDEGADWASQWYALGEGGQPRYKDPANWETILKGYKDRSIQKSGVDPTDAQLLDIAEKARKSGNTRKADMLEAVVTEHGRNKGQPQKVEKSVSVTTEDFSTGDKVTRKMTEDEFSQSQASKPLVLDTETTQQLSTYAEEKAALSTGDTAKGPDWLGLSDRARNLAELKTKLEQKGINPDTGTRLSTNTPSANTAPSIPTPHSDYLRAHPETAEDFDAKYGAGSAAKILNTK